MVSYVGEALAIARNIFDPGVLTDGPHRRHHEGGDDEDEERRAVEEVARGEADRREEHPGESRSDDGSRVHDDLVE